MSIKCSVISICEKISKIYETAGDDLAKYSDKNVDKILNLSRKIHLIYKSTNKTELIDKKDKNTNAILQICNTISDFYSYESCHSISARAQIFVIFYLCKAIKILCGENKNGN